MNSFQDLNGWGNANITYTSEADYVIEFSGTGNATITVTEDNDFFATKQRSITTLDNPVRDIKVIFDINDANAINGFEYIGDYSNITVTTITPNVSYRIDGIRSIDQYDEAIGNSVFSTALDYTNAWSYVTTVTDTIGNTESWSTAVTIEADSDYVVANISSRTQAAPDYLIEKNNLLYGNTNTTVSLSEFTNNNTGFFAYRSIPSTTQVARTTLTTTGNLIQDSVSANSHVIVGNGNVLIDTLETTTIYDFDGGSDSEFTISIQKPVTLSNVITVTDAANLLYSSTFTVANTSQGQLIHYGNSAVVSNVTVTGNISSIGQQLANIGFIWTDSYQGQSTLLYDQIRTSDSTTQASNVSVSVYPNSENKQTINYKRVATPDTGLYPMRWASNLRYVSGVDYEVDFDWYRANTVASGSGISVPVPYNTSFYVEDSAVINANDEIGLWLTATSGVTWYYRGQSFANRIYLGYGYNFGTGYGPNLGGTTLSYLQAAMNHRNFYYRRTGSGEITVTIKLMRKRSGVSEETLVSSSLVLNDDYI